jgi:cysteine desulfurase/selenocysteine lyase
MSSFDVYKIRQDFPILNQTLKNGQPLVYLDNAATSQKPQAVIDAIVHYYTYANANVHRGVHTLSERATEAYESARIKIQRFINAPAAKECIFTRGTTEAINLVAQSFVAPRLKTGDEIVITQLEHHSNIVPWQLICKKTGAILRVIPINNKGELELDSFKELLSEKTKFVSLGHISNAIGTINPIKTVIDLAHQYNIPVLIDGAQAAPHLSHIDVQALGCDFYAFSGHKMFAGTGIGVLWGKEKYLEMAEPYQGGGEMISRVQWDHSDYKPIPHKFEAGTQHIEGVITLGAAIDYLNTLDREAALNHENDLFMYAKERLQAQEHIRLIGTADHKAAILSFVHEKIHAHDIGTILDSRGVAVRSGHHCAMPLMEFFKVPATTRASFAFYNTREEVDHFIEGMAYVHQILGV